MINWCRLLGDNEGMYRGRVVVANTAEYVVVMAMPAAHTKGSSTLRLDVVFFFPLGSPFQRARARKRLETCVVASFGRGKGFPTWDGMHPVQSYVWSDRVGGESTELQSVLVEERVSSLARYSPTSFSEKQVGPSQLRGTELGRALSLPRRVS